ncbi:MAG TPA: hypothetical protein VEW42_02250 [Candidatus Eisenbacteria bacterium]|nr:hypothetical protein [Candidatus Eisenbacteria bacterium]
MDEQTLRKILKEELKGTEERLQKQLTDVIEKEVGDLSGQIVELSQKLDRKADISEVLPLKVRLNKIEEKVFPN